MPSASLNVDWGILSNIGIEAAQSTRDGLNLTSGLHAAWAKMYGKGKPAWQSGARRGVGVQMFEHTGITEFLDGFEEFDSSATEPDRVPLFKPAFAGLLLKIGLVQIGEYGSASTKKLTPVVEKLVTNGIGILTRAHTKRIVDGRGNGFTQWTSWNGIDSTLGVFERSAVGSQSNTISGLSKSTYSGVIGWNNPVVNMANAYGSNQNGLTRGVIATERHKVGQMRKYWLFSDTARAFQKRVVQPNERYFAKDGGLDSGIPVEYYHKYPIYGEPQMPVDGTSTTTYPISMLLIDADDLHPEWLGPQKVDGISLPDGHFGVGSWEKISGMQMVWGCPVLVAGQNIVEDMGSSCLFHSGEIF